ncbi:MAG: glycoside hydrolase family 30 beta sandwich domain-containing protein [Chitinophagales bacterium]
MHNFAHAQKEPTKNESISVWVSAQAGDRLTRKPDLKLIANQESSVPEIRVDESKSYQKIEGFGATFNEAGMICLNTLSPYARDQVFSSLFDPEKGAGFTLMKSPIASCDFASAGSWYSYDEAADDTLMNHFSIQRDLGPNGLVTFIKKAAQFGKFRIEAPMDFAPDWMYYGFKAGQKHIKPQYYPALARYYSKYLQSYEHNGVHIDFLNLFNEANNEWYSNVTYPEIAEMIRNYVGPKLKSDGLTTQIQFGETANRPEAIQKFPPALDDPNLQTMIHSLTVHGYDWNNFYALTDLHNRYPQLPIWQTEVCYAMPNNLSPKGPTKLPIYEFADGEYWGNMIINDMKNWVSAWIYWNMILDEQGGPWLVSVEHGDPDQNKQHPVLIIDRKTKKVHYTGLYYYLAHFSKFVRPGAQRIDCHTPAPNLNVVAFQNADKSIVLNIINNGDEIQGKLIWKNQMVIHSLPAHSISTWKWTSE